MNKAARDAMKAAKDAARAAQAAAKAARDAAKAAPRTQTGDYVAGKVVEATGDETITIVNGRTITGDAYKTSGNGRITWH
ncbi:hypothetical protein IMZ11_42145 [Microtetraspora sp. AC03309]|uniref:hypothetical protein n=1 Tax=Microtetraspora sp. AC03309 TaxID=2779376 RepID=UPI001E43EDAA|nr:hypothetical protein [Microtetraspora sp. AC03309]MCC5582210.1 hypothetical protein [Microtetraspora sp. AC03309]